jgi:hypothetical protein
MVFRLTSNFMKYRILIFWLLFACPGTPAIAIDFAHEIVPILRSHCAECHAASEAKGGFSINTRDSFLESEAAVVGDSEESYFLELVRSADPDLQMPPKDRPRVPADQVARLASWVDADIPWTQSFTFAEDTYEPPLLPRQVTLPGDPNEHPIDRIIDEYLGNRDLPLPELVDDATFVRRASLDLIGLLPPVERVDEFTANPSQQKYTELVDELLASDVAYAEHWLTFWNDLLRNDYEGTGFITGGRKQISGWLYRSLIDNKPFDQFTRELIAPESDESRGFIDGIKWRGTVSAGQTVQIQFAQSVAQSFLGINLKCASCHDSFIDRWKLSDAYSLAAVYAESPLEIHRCDKPTGTRATAAWLFPELGQIDPASPRQQRLEQLAALITDHKNGRFNRTIVNRLWAQLMGRGIVHPLDAMQTRPWNEDLLDHLANHLVGQDYDLKAVVRLIATSRAYRSRSDFGAVEQGISGQYVYRGPRAKRMTAEQFVDSVWQLTAAAPTTFDAPIVRGNSERLTGDSIELQGQWIWGESARDGRVPPGSEQLVFRKRFELPANVTRGVAVVTADNAFDMYVARRSAAGSEDWTRPQVVPLAGLLKEGENEIVVVARNFLDEPNLAGLFFEAHLLLADGQSIAIVSDDSWQVSAASPRGGREGRLGQTPGPWQQAISLGRPAVYGKVLSLAASSLELGLSPETSMVRASLLKSDFLMRSLGRPNRDQIVTSRPSSLTTLEAIDLAGGETLASALASGAKRLAGRTDLTSEQLIDELFRSALARTPSASELKILTESIGDPASEQTIADVLWAICMMPEFIMVR